MKQFPIMEMQPGDAVTVTDEWGTYYGTVIWWDNYEGFRVSVKLESGDDQVFEAYGPRACSFWH